MASLVGSNLTAPLIVPANTGINGQPPPASGRDRNPFYITTDAWSAQGQALAFWINPSETQWKIATRTQIEQIQGGVVHHEWRTTGVTGTQPDDSKFDMPTVNFSFQAGNISQTEYGYGADVKTFTPPPGVGNFYDFLELLDQPTMQKVTGEPNYVHIYYNSNLFPDFWMYGFFSQEGVQWTESADNPNTITGWGASFIIFGSSPSLRNAEEMSSMYNSAWFSRVGYGG